MAESIVYNRHVQDMDNELELAIKSRNPHIVRNIIQDGADVNKQNSDGDTALHIAISCNAGLDILQTLLANGACINTKNKIGKTPLYCIQEGSLDTILNLLQLEKSFNFTSFFGNTLIHSLVEDKMNLHSDIGDYEEIEMFWTQVRENSSDLKIDLNAQNALGQTPLHLISKSVWASRHLELILTHFDNLNLFLLDYKGDTFLHEYLQWVDIETNCDVFYMLLGGQFHYCPEGIVKDLLGIQNAQKDSPLHSFLKNIMHGNLIDSEVLQTFIDAGANLNVKNSLGKSILHCIIRDLSNRGTYVEEEQEHENIQLLINNGAEINSCDEIGETPIFCNMKSIDSMLVLLEMGADVNIKNKYGQTALVSHLHDSDILKLLLDKGINVNAVDINGSTVLHQAAWVGVESEIVRLLLNSGAQIVPDKIGQLPCQVAYQRRQEKLFDILCICVNGSHTLKDDNFYFSNVSLKFDELKTLNKKQSREQSFKRYQRFHDNTINDILDIPGIGAVVFKEEAELVKATVNEIVAIICTGITGFDEFLKCTSMQSGSVGEHTKVGLPDEFDFVCKLDKISETCFVDEKTTKWDSGYACIKLKGEFEDYKRSYSYLFTDEGFLDTPKVWNVLSTYLSILLRKPETYPYPNIYFENDNLKTVNSPNFQFTLRWIGSCYKSLEIDVDLVIACQIKEWWPTNANLGSVDRACKEEGALLLLQTELNDIDEDDAVLRVSALKAEKHYMEALPQIARDAYMASKCMCDNRICPSINKSVNVLTIDVVDVEAKELLTSYMLKNCMFYVFEESKLLRQTNKQTLGKSGTDETNLNGYVRQIFQKLLQFTYAKNVPSFFFPWQNIFTFTQKRMMSEEMNHTHCEFRRVFVKVILQILGENQDFEDCDWAILSKYPGYMELVDCGDRR